MITYLQNLPFHLGKRRLLHTLRTRPDTSSATSEALLKALRSVILRDHNTDEQDWLQRIEQLRMHLSASPEAIQVEDFGAGVSGQSGHTVGVGSQFRTVGEICRSSSISQSWGTMLFQIVRHTRPSVCLELGTSLGISSSYLGAACALNGSGSILTLEGAPSLVDLARRNHASLGLTMITAIPGRFRDTLPSVLSGNHPVDFVFIDGHHDRNATMSYFAQIKPFLSTRAIVLFDDILWSSGMRQAWREIRRNAGSAVTLDLMRMGVYLSEG